MLLTGACLLLARLMC